MTKRRQQAIDSQAAITRSGPFVAAVLAALLQSAPAMAQISESECVQRAEAIKTAVVRAFGGDDITYGFFRRADQASELCREGQIQRALDIVAALKADMRGYRSENRDR